MPSNQPTAQETRIIKMFTESDIDLDDRDLANALACIIRLEGIIEGPLTPGFVSKILTQPDLIGEIANALKKVESSRQAHRARLATKIFREAITSLAAGNTITNVFNTLRSVDDAKLATTLYRINQATLAIRRELNTHPDIPRPETILPSFDVIERHNTHDQFHTLLNALRQEATPPFIATLNRQLEIGEYHGALTTFYTIVMIDPDYSNPKVQLTLKAALQNTQESSIPNAQSE